jgi:hypothetical protein
MENNEFYLKRQLQLKLWFWTHLKENLLEALLSKPDMRKKLEHLENQVLNGINPDSHCFALVIVKTTKKKTLYSNFR